MNPFFSVRPVTHRFFFLGTVFLLSFLLVGLTFVRVIFPQRALVRWPSPVEERGRVVSADGSLLASGPVTARVYPLGTTMSPIVGFVGRTEGLEGLERTQEAALRQGKTVALTLDARIQEAAERILMAAVARTNAEFASAVVLESQTGAVIAAASVPGFDPNAWETAPATRWRNRAVLDEYEPGSVIKPLTVAALLDAGLTTPETLYDTPMARRYAGATINDIVPHPPQLSTQQVLRYSSNVGMTHLVEGVPSALLYRYFTAFGLGQDVTLGLPTSNGLLRDPASWTPLGQATMAFGQGMTATTIQMAAAFNVLAAGGRFLPPYLLQGSKPLNRYQVIKPETARQMQAMLHAVIDDGIKTKAELPGYHVAGKTGTAQVVVGGRYSPNVFTSTFAGFSPPEQPRFTVAVMVRGAQRDYQGSQLAAPVFKEISAALFSLYAMSPAQSPVPRQPEAP
jgi:cell division protein FtsI (penicillin-binding protein 3)